MKSIWAAGVSHGQSGGSTAAESVVSAPESAAAAGSAKQNTWTDSSSSSDEDERRERDEGQKANFQQSNQAPSGGHVLQDSFNWSGGTENGLNGDRRSDGRNGVVAAASAVTIVVTEEGDAEHKVLLWARGKDIVGLLQTFSLIYQGEDKLPDSLINPSILSAGDVRKTYL